MKSAKYLNAGTVEFLIDQQGRHYFIEVKAPLINACHAALTIMPTQAVAVALTSLVAPTRLPS